MSEETTPTQPTEAPSAATNTGGEDRGAKRFPRDKDASMPGMGGEPRARGRKRRKVSYLTINKIDTVDYKDVAILKRFLNDRGKILPTRQTGNTAKQQRMIARAIRRAREMALLPFVVTEFVADRPPRPRREYEPRREYNAPQQPQAEAPVEAPAEAPAETAEAQ